MKKLIINADDFGLTEGINKGITEAHRLGLITSTTLMPNMPAFDDAINCISNNPALGVGIHLNILRGESILSKEKISTIVDESGHFLGSPFTLINKILFKQIQISHIEDELRAQIEKVLKVGIEITHLDSHKHFHCYPPIFRIVIRLALEYGIKKIRYINERAAAFNNKKTFPWIKCAFINPRYYNLNLLNYFCHMIKPELKKKSILSPDYFFGILHSGSMSVDIYELILNSLAEGTTEIMSHPGYNSDTLKQISFLTASREEELRILMNPRLKEIVAKKNITLVNYRNLN